MMWFIKASVLLVVQVFCLTLVIGLNCSNQCCYYYNGVPANVTSMPCNPDGSTITWECLVYSPHDPDTSLSVKWYRSTLEVPIREEGELITEMKGGRYAFSVTQATSPVNNSQSLVNGLFLDIFQLTIHSYDSNIDSGYYWCQMVVNDTACLQQSDIGRITPSSVLTRNCSFSPLDFTAFKMPQVCARRSSCTREVTTTEAEPPVTSTQSQGQDTTLNSTLSMTTAASNNVMSEFGTMTVIILYGVIGVLVFIIVFLLLVIVAFTVYTIRNRRAFEIKVEYDHELEVKDPPNQLSNINDQITQSGDHTASTEIIHRLETPREREESLPSTHSFQPGAPPPNSSPPQPPTTPSDNPPQPKSDNPTSFSRSSSKTDDHYARPVHRQLQKAMKSSPAIGGRYQDIRVSRLDYVHMYNVATNANQPGAPPPQSLTTPIDSPPKPTGDNPTSFSHLSSKSDDHYKLPAQRPPPNSSPPEPCTTPTDNPPQPTNDNSISFPRISSKTDDREATKSSAAIGGRYQDIRVSRLDYVQMYSVATNAKRTTTEMKDDPNSNLKPK